MHHLSPNRTWQSQDNHALLTFLRPLLTSLLLHPTPELSPNQRSPDLLMRQRMLHLPPTTPLLYEDGSSDVARHSREQFVSWMSRPPIELSLTDTDVATTASAFIMHRQQALLTSQTSDEDPFDECGWHALCCDAWHDQRKLLAGLPRKDEGARLFMTVVAGENGEVQLDNLFALQEHQEEAMRGLHRWTDECRHSWARPKMAQDEHGVPAAEYINDADDFWAGYSDEEDAGLGSAKGATGVQPATGRSEGALGTTSTTTTTTADQEAAIKDIIRGAYTLYRSTRPSTTEVDSTEAFLRLVRSALPANTA